MVPVPHYSLHKKYAYFYDPYSQACNTKKFMTFSEPDTQVLEEGVRQKSTTWNEVDHFIRKEDERVYLFVINQLRKKLGNRQPLPKKKLKKTISSVQIKTEKINQLFEKIDTVD